MGAPTNELLSALIPNCLNSFNWKKRRPMKQNLRDIFDRNNEQQQPAVVETTRRQFDHCAGTSPSPAPPAKKERSEPVEGDEDNEREHLSEFIRKNRLIEEAELVEKQLSNYQRCTELGLPARIHLPVGTGPRRSQRQCRRFTTFSNTHACQFDAERRRADVPPRDGDLNESSGYKFWSMDSAGEKLPPPPPPPPPMVTAALTAQKVVQRSTTPIHLQQQQQAAAAGVPASSSLGTASLPQYHVNPLSSCVAQHGMPASKYQQLLMVVDELGRDIRPTYNASRNAQERLKRSIIQARVMVRECMAELEQQRKQQQQQQQTNCPLFFNAFPLVFKQFSARREATARCSSTTVRLLAWLYTNCRSGEAVRCLSLADFLHYFCVQIENNYLKMTRKHSVRSLDVVHSGLVLWQRDGKMPRRECMARLLLTKDVLSVQVPAGSGEEELNPLQMTIGSTSDVAAANGRATKQFVALRTVNVPKGSEGLGLSIKGGTEGSHHVPIVISKVLPGLPAAQTGQVFVGDLIVEVNGISLEGKTHEEVVQLLRDSPAPHVTLTLKRDNKVSPLLRDSECKHSLPSLMDLAVFKSALKSPAEELSDERRLEDESGGEEWKTAIRIPLPLAFLSRNLWATDKLRSNAFEVRSVDGRASGIIHCEDRRALEQWVNHINAHINVLNRKSMRLSNKYLHATDRISYINWVEERMPDGHFEDAKQRWERRFLLFKGANLCLFESPPLNADELDNCLSMNKVYETALRTAIKRSDRREHVFALATVRDSAEHYCSFQSRDQLHQFEMAYYSCMYKAVNTIQTRTFACSYDGRPAGLVIDLRLGFSLYDIPTKCYLWQYGFNELEASSDDGKMRVQFIFHNDVVVASTGIRQLDVKDIECDEPLVLVFTLHSFYIAKVMGTDPEFLQSLPLS
uniref:PDZ domain-containing protein n=1 Tax=Globodera rostochiensis TaxID=31243 RepID=A0A914HSD4_GLORO